MSFCGLPGVIADGSMADRMRSLQSTRIGPRLDRRARRGSVSLLDPPGRESSRQDRAKVVGRGIDFYNRLVDGLLARD